MLSLKKELRIIKGKLSIQALICCPHDRKCKPKQTGTVSVSRLPVPDTCVKLLGLRSQAT